MNIKYILFDNDGTLYELDQGFKEAVVGRMTSFLAQKLQIPEDRVIEERKRLIRKYGVESTEFVFGREYGVDYDEFVKGTYLLVPIEEHGVKHDGRLQTMLQNIEIPRAVLTNNPSEFARKILRSLGVEQFFEHVIGSREMNYRLKPNREAFLRAVDITRSDPKTTMFVDDIPEFHKPAKELGMTTVLIGSRTRQEKKDYVDYEIERIYELKQILKGE